MALILYATNGIWQEKKQKAKNTGKENKTVMFAHMRDCLSIQRRQKFIKTEEFNNIVQHYHLYAESKK